MGLQTDCEPIFAGHQTFHPRFGWIKKAFDGITSDPKAFLSEEATVSLGVGKNMVEAIKFWGQAFRVIGKSPNSKKKRELQLLVTEFGSAIFDSEIGLDPYLENPSTLWLLHWEALAAKSALPVWRIFFNEFSAIEFTESEFLRFADEQISGTTWKKPVSASIEKDFDCLIRMYSKKAIRGRQTIDDLLDSPFRQLGLVLPSPAGNDSYRFALEEKPFLTDEVILFSALDYLLRTDPHGKTITTTRLTSDSGSPGRIFKIGEDRITSALENCATSVPGIAIASPAGATQLVVDGEINSIGHKLLNRLYKVNKANSKRNKLKVFGVDSTTFNLNQEISFEEGIAS